MLRKKLEDKLHDIQKSLIDTTLGDDSIGILAGSTGMAVFHFYYGRHYPNEHSVDLGSLIISDAVGAINEGYDYPTFCGGIAGAAWAIELLNQEQLIDIDTDELLGDLDEYLKQMMTLNKNENFFDFLHGLLGIALYFLKRYENTHSNTLRARYEELLHQVVLKFEDAVVDDERGLHWPSFLVRKEQLRGTNLSLSHGLSSIINFMSRLGKHPRFTSRVQPLVEGAIKFTLNLSHKNKSTISSFPDWLTDSGELGQSDRLAWCYGDLGIGLSLLRGADFLGDEALQKKSIAVLKKASLRRNPEEARVMDAGVCHGAFGIAHVFEFLHRETEEVAFKETAEYWLSIGLDMATHSDGLAGYKTYRGGNNPSWKNEPSLLEGVAGIGLVILSHLYPQCNAWNQCLLLGD